MLQTVAITVQGKVQGVFFRKYTREKALELGLKGWVRNLPDGSVSIRASGSREQTDRLYDWCRSGPPKAKVTSIIIQNHPYDPFDDFTIEK